MDKRPIKFRSFDGKKMDYDPVIYGSHEIGECWMNGSIKERQEEGIVFMQYTGFKDKAGKEIYEGDLLRIYWPSGRISESKVIWDFGSWQIKGFGLFSNAQEEWLEVIGNVYETPEIV